MKSKIKAAGLKKIPGNGTRWSKTGSTRKPVLTWEGAGLFSVRGTGDSVLYVGSSLAEALRSFKSRTNPGRKNPETDSDIIDNFVAHINYYWDGDEYYDESMDSDILYLLKSGGDYLDVYQDVVLNGESRNNPCRRDKKTNPMRRKSLKSFENFRKIQNVDGGEQWEKRYTDGDTARVVIYTKSITRDLIRKHFENQEYGEKFGELLYDNLNPKTNPGRKAATRKGGRTMATRKQIAAARRNIKKAQKKRRSPAQKAASKRNVKKAIAANRKRCKPAAKRKPAKRKTTKRKAAKKSTAKKSGALNAHKGQVKGQHVKRGGRYYIVVAGRKLRKSSASAAAAAKKRKSSTKRR